MVYFFGGGKADGNAGMKNLLGGKGANLAEMAKIGVPVPPGFTITTDVCVYFYQNKRKYPQGLKDEVAKAVTKVEKVMGKKFGDAANPLLVSVRSGARKSMPGMMETVLNIGLTTKTIPGLVRKTNNERFVYDAYRRLMMMYSDVVMEKAAGVEPEESQVGKYADTMVALEGQKAQQMLKLVETLEDHEDVQNVWANFDISEKEMEEAAAAG